MSDLIGMCIDNTNQISTTIGITLQINDRMNSINNIMDIEEQNNTKNPTRELLDEIQNGIGVIKDQYAKFAAVVEEKRREL